MADEWLDGRVRLRSSTRLSYVDAIRLYLRPGLGHIRLDRLRAADIRRLYATIRSIGGTDAALADADLLGALLQVRGDQAGRRSRPPGPAVIAKVHAILRAALNAAVREELIPRNPALSVELAEMPRPQTHVWTPEQAGAFLSSVTAERLAPLYRLVIVTGVRRGEACGLRWSDVELDAGRLRVAQQLVTVGHRLEFGPPKTKSGARTIALDERTVDALAAHRKRQIADRLAWGPAWQDRDLVFGQEDGSPLHPNVVSRSFVRLARRAGVASGQVPCAAPHVGLDRAQLG